MSWVLLDDNFPNHPKAVEAGPVASYLFVCGLCYCRRFHTEGFIPMKAIPTLGLTARPSRMIASLVKAGLWDRVEDGSGFTIHGYSSFYADAMEKAIKENRREHGRKGGIEARRLNGFASEPTGNGSGAGSSVQLVKKEERTSGFELFWENYPKKDGKKVARASWERLNPSEETQRLIAADVERRRRSSQWLKDGGQFVPHASTYLNQERFGDGFVEQPRLSERTINVLKGFEEPT